jgi:hypothetical protein
MLLCSQPNKVYIGGLPEHTREADLHNCFGKIGNIVNIELKYVLACVLVVFQLFIIISIKGLAMVLW